MAFLFILGQALPAYLVGGCGTRAVSRKTPIYFIFSWIPMVIFLNRIDWCNTEQLKLLLQIQETIVHWYICGGTWKLLLPFPDVSSYTLQYNGTIPILVNFVQFAFLLPGFGSLFLHPAKATNALHTIHAVLIMILLHIEILLKSDFNFPSVNYKMQSNHLQLVAENRNQCKCKQNIWIDWESSFFFTLKPGPVS